jgi:hypothetical protein
MSTPTEGAPAAPAAPKPIRIAPIVTPDAKTFWEACDREEFIGQKCGDCGQFVFPPRPMCPHCHSLNRQEVKLAGTGKVVSWTIPRHPPPFGFREAPVVAVIELAEGIRMVSNVVGIKPEDMKMDMEVEVGFEDTMNKHKVHVFRPRS